MWSRSLRNGTGGVGPGGAVFWGIACGNRMNSHSRSISKKRVFDSVNPNKIVALRDFLSEPESDGLGSASSRVRHFGAMKFARLA